ncbi:MAG: lipopolysaccharide kinase InaA family protein [Planctomycetota bacterium]
MLELKNIYPDLVIPPYFHTNESSKEWRIIHQDYESGVNSLFDGEIDTSQVVTTVKGRGRYIVAHIKSPAGKNEEVIMKTYKRGGLTALFLPDIFNDVMRPLNELVLTEKARTNDIAVPEILGIQIRWITLFLFRAKIIFKKIPDTMTLEDFIMFLLRNYKDKHSELYQKKRNLIKSISQTIGQLHQIGIYHNDLNIRNILVQILQTTNSPLRTYIIDLDKSTYESRCSSGLPLNKRVDNLIRLNRSLEKMIVKFKSFNINSIITHTDRLLLFKTCLNESSLGGKDQKRLIINKCFRHTRLHKWWWKLYGGLY